MDELLRTCLNSLDQGFCTFDEKHRLTVRNSRFVTLSHLPPALLSEGQSYHEILAYLSESETYRWKKALGTIYGWLENSRERTTHNLEIGGTNDKALMLKLVISPGEGTVFLLSDISEGRHALKMVQQAKSFLEQRVTERTSELTKVNLKLMSEIEERKVMEHALRDANAEAVEAHLSKTKFLAAASHDLLQPLNAARLFLTALKEQQDEPIKRNELVHSVDRSMASVEDLIGSLLDLSKLDAKAISVQIETIPVHEILRPLHREFNAIAQGKGLTVCYVPSRLLVKTDRRLFRRVVQNLLSNAIRYTNSGRILMGTRVNNGKVYVQVYDTGPGIPQSRQKEIFQEFHRLEADTQTPGHGLGLAIVQRAVDALGSTLLLASNVGKGSTFGLSLPFAGRSETLFTRPIPITRSKLDTAKNSFIVLIENDHEIVKALSTLFENWGIPLVNYTQAEQFFHHHIESDPPAIIVLDYHLNGKMTGLDFAEALVEKWAKVPPMILSTAERSNTVEDRAEALGINILHKPVRGGKLRALIESLL